MYCAHSKTISTIPIVVGVCALQGRLVTRWIMRSPISLACSSKIDRKCGVRLRFASCLSRWLLRECSSGTRAPESLTAVARQLVRLTEHISQYYEKDSTTVHLQITLLGRRSDTHRVCRLLGDLRRPQDAAACPYCNSRTSISSTGYLPCPYRSPFRRWQRPCSSASKELRNSTRVLLRLAERHIFLLC